MRSLAGAFGLLLLLLVLGAGAASATTVGPVQPPTGSGQCSPEPLIPGAVGQDGSLVVLLQPGPSSGSTCGLPSGGTLVGDQIILGLYTPNPVPNDSALVVVDEYQLKQVDQAVPGPNGTTEHVPVLEHVQETWSNVTLGAQPGEVGEYLLTVPPVPTAENLTVSVLGVVAHLTIVVPGAGIAIPQDYPQLLLHDFSFQVYVVVFILAGIGIATALKLRARHLERIWPFGVVGLFATIGFVAFAYSDYPYSLVPIGQLPEAVVATPVVLASLFFWLAFSPTETRIHRIRFPKPELRDGTPLVGSKRFRVFNGPDGKEYIGRGGAGAFLRILGVRTYLDDQVATPVPHLTRVDGFESAKYDVFAEYYAWSEFPEGPKVLEVVPPRIFWLPWRKRTREAIAAYHAQELRGKSPVPTHLGVLLYVSPSRAFANVVGKQNAILVQGWISGTLQASRVGNALEKVLTAYTHLKVSLKAEAIDYGHKLALALRMAEDYPGSPVALKALEDLATRHEAALMDERTWFAFLEQKVQEDRTPTDRPGAVGAAEQILNEARNPVPPDLRSRRAPGPDLERGAE